MLPSEATLALWYLGVGYLAFLGWAAMVHDLVNSEVGTTPRRTRPVAVACVVAGAFHPAFALAAYDVTRQLRNEGDPLDAWPARLGTVAIVVGATSTVVAATLLSGAIG